MCSQGKGAAHKRLPWDMYILTTVRNQARYAGNLLFTQRRPLTYIWAQYEGLIHRGISLEDANGSRSGSRVLTSSLSHLKMFAERGTS